MPNPEQQPSTATMTYDLTPGVVARIEAVLPDILPAPVAQVDQRLVYTAAAARDAIDEDWLDQATDEQINALIGDEPIYNAWWQMLDRIRAELKPPQPPQSLPTPTPTLR